MSEQDDDDMGIYPPEKPPDYDMLVLNIIIFAAVAVAIGAIANVIFGRF